MTVEWIDCKVALPTDNKLKLIWVENVMGNYPDTTRCNMVWFAYYDGEGWWFRDSEFNEATYWAEMPEGPNKNECNK